MADSCPPALRFDLFDAAVNSGPVQAVKWMQRAVGVADDGKQFISSVLLPSNDDFRLPVHTFLSHFDVFGSAAKSGNSIDFSANCTHSESAHADQLHENIANVLSRSASAFIHIVLHRLLCQRFGLFWSNHLQSLPFGG